MSSHEIVKLLEKENNSSLLKFFHTEAVKKKTDRNYLIWEDTVVRIIETPNVLMDLLEYTHNNPVSKKWHLANSRAEYMYSSACYYENGVAPIIPVNDVRELL